MPKTFGWTAVSVFIFMSSVATLHGDSFSVSLIPSSGDVSGPAGSTVGWGYSLDNESLNDWLVTTNLQAGTFLNGSPNSLFDFPDLGPGDSAMVTFDPVAGTGLYELTWDGSAPSGFTDTGTFELDAEWWSGDPLNGGSFISEATPIFVSYSAVVESGVTSAVPEPSSLPMMILIWLCVLGVIRTGKQSSIAR